MKLSYLILFLILGFSNAPTFAQEGNDSTNTAKKYFLIIKNDGSEYYGYIVSDDGREILLETKNIGKIYIN